MIRLLKAESGAHQLQSWHELEQGIMEKHPAYKKTLRKTHSFQRIGRFKVWRVSPHPPQADAQVITHTGASIRLEVRTRSSKTGLNMN